MPQWIQIAVVVVLAILSPVLAWWGSTRYFVGRFDEWKRHSEEWRRLTDVRLDNLDPVKRAELAAQMEQRVKTLEIELDKIRKWRHERGDPYISALNALEPRVSKLEARRTRNEE